MNTIEQKSKIYIMIYKMAFLIQDTNTSSLNDVLLAKMVHLDYNCQRNLHEQLTINPPQRIICLMNESLEVLSYLLLKYYNGVLHVGNICVHPTYRKKGVCTYMIKFLVEKYGDFTIRIDVPPEILNSVNCFRKNGFEFIDYAEKDQVYIRHGSFAREELRNSENISYYILLQQGWYMMSEEEVKRLFLQYSNYENIKQQQESYFQQQQQQESYFQQQQQQREQARQQTVLEPTFCEKYKCKGKTVKKCYRLNSIKGEYRHPDKGGDPEKNKELNSDFDKIKEQGRESEEC